MYHVLQVVESLKSEYLILETLILPPFFVLTYHPKMGNAKSTGVAKCFFYSYTSNRVAYCCCILVQHHFEMIIHIVSPRKMTGSDVQKINKRCEMTNCRLDGMFENLQISKKFELFSAAQRYICVYIPCYFRVRNCHLNMR